MATKKLKTLEVHLMLNSEVVSIADTATDNKATRALNEFKAYDTMRYDNSGVTISIPYHAVQYIKVTEADAEVADKADPYGCVPCDTNEGSGN